MLEIKDLRDSKGRRRISFPYNNETKHLGVFLTDHFYIMRKEQQNFLSDDCNIDNIKVINGIFQLDYTLEEITQAFFHEYPSEKFAEFLEKTGKFDGFDDETQRCLNEISNQDNYWKYLRLITDSIFITVDNGWQEYDRVIDFGYLQGEKLTGEEINNFLPKYFFSQSINLNQKWDSYTENKNNISKPIKMSKYGKTRTVKKLQKYLKKKEIKKPFLLFNIKKHIDYSSHLVNIIFDREWNNKKLTLEGLYSYYTHKERGFYTELQINKLADLFNLNP